MWKQWVTGSHSFRPATSVVVMPEGEDTVVGYVTTHEWEAYQQATGRRRRHHQHQVERHATSHSR